MDEVVVEEEEIVDEDDDDSNDTEDDKKDIKQIKEGEQRQDGSNGRVKHEIS